MLDLWGQIPESVKAALAKKASADVYNLIKTALSSIRIKSSKDHVDELTQLNGRMAEIMSEMRDLRQKLNEKDQKINDLTSELAKLQRARLG